MKLILLFLTLVFSNLFCADKDQIFSNLFWANQAQEFGKKTRRVNATLVEGAYQKAQTDDKSIVSKVFAWRNFDRNYRRSRSRLETFLSAEERQAADLGILCDVYSSGYVGGLYRPEIDHTHPRYKKVLEAIHKSGSRAAWEARGYNAFLEQVRDYNDSAGMECSKIKYGPKGIGLRHASDFLAAYDSGFIYGLHMAEKRASAEVQESAKKHRENFDKIRKDCAGRYFAEIEEYRAIEQRKAQRWLYIKLFGATFCIGRLLQK